MLGLVVLYGDIVLSSSTTYVRYHNDLGIYIPGQEPHQSLPHCNPECEPPASTKSTSLPCRQSSLLNSSSSGSSGLQSPFHRMGGSLDPDPRKLMHSKSGVLVTSLMARLKYPIKQLTGSRVCVGAWFDGKMAGSRSR